MFCVGEIIFSTHHSTCAAVVRVVDVVTSGNLKYGKNVDQVQVQFDGFLVSRDWTKRLD